MIEKHVNINTFIKNKNLLLNINFIEFEELSCYTLLNNSI